jgi:PIF1-like helicase
MQPSNPDEPVTLTLTPPGDASRMASLDMAYGKLVQDAALITIDEVTMMKAAELDAIVAKLDDLAFQGALVIAGNCEQLGPVLPGIAMHKHASYALPAASSFNTRFRHAPLRSQQRVRDPQLLDMVRAIGNGTYPRYQPPAHLHHIYPLASFNTEYEYLIELPSDVFIPIPASQAYQQALPWVHASMYPEHSAGGNTTTTSSPHFDTSTRPAIATTTNSAAAEFNDVLVSRLQTGDVTHYYAWNEVLDPGVGHTFADAAKHAYGRLSADTCSTLEHSGVPRQHLQLNVGTPVHVLGNLDFKAGLCKGELATIVALGNHTVTITLLDPPDSKHATFVLPRIIFDFQPLGIPVKVRRHQFPLAVAFASTTHRIQGATINRLLVDVRHPLFAHGQLYVDTSRVQERQHMRFLVPDSQILEGGRSWVTTNIVIKQMLTDATLFD